MSQSTNEVKPVSIPEEFRPYHQFVLWRLEKFPNESKPRKIPYSPITLNHASTTDRSTWAAMNDAINAYSRGGFNGIGFVFTADDPFTFFDIDNCLGADGKWLPHAGTMMRALGGAWEVSQSGRGLHGIGTVADKGALAGLRNRWTGAAGQDFECYWSGRFMAIGGGGWTGAVQDWTHKLPLIVPLGGPQGGSGSASMDSWTDASRPDWDGPADDDELVAAMLAATPARERLGGKPPFAALWHAWPELGDFYPDDAGRRPFDHSRADLALADALAWWTGCNPVRMLRLFKRSALYRPDQSRKAVMAINKAIASPTRGYRVRRDRLAEDAAIGAGAGLANLPTKITLAEAMTGLVFVAGGSSIVHRATKRTRALADAKNDFAASVHEFETGDFDSMGRPKIKRTPVIGAWLADDRRLTVDAVTWQPGQPEFCGVLERDQGGDRAYNTWTPPTWLTAPNDWSERVKPFLQHVEYLVPIANERELFLDWIAHIFQRPGELPHVHYLMVTAQTGTGRGTLAGILARALRGYVAINMDVEALFGGFNGRVSQKLLATVDEIREGNSANRYEKAEALKSRINEETRHINPKYGLQSVEKNCCRWLMFSNHMDALPFDPSDRRIIVIENPIERAQPDWYSYLHSLMRDDAFIASVQQWALARDIAAFNPFSPATMNDAKAKALKALESPLDAACRQFAFEWPDDIAALSDIAAFAECEAKSAALAHAIERAGMRKAHRIKYNGARETLLIVRGPLGADDYKSADPAILAARIIAARGKF